MSNKLRAPNTPRLGDIHAEQARVEHEQKIRELQDLPTAGLELITGITLIDNTPTPIAHVLGRLPKWIVASTPRSAKNTVLLNGAVQELRHPTPGATGVDRTKMVVLLATGFGSTITVDLAVM